MPIDQSSELSVSVFAVCPATRISPELFDSELSKEFVYGSETTPHEEWRLEGVRSVLQDGTSMETGGG